MRSSTVLVVLILLALIAVGLALARRASGGTASEPAPAPRPANGETAAAIFAGGCFWCMEPPFDRLPGVLDTISGYTGGHVEDPTYEQVSSGGTGHAEVVKVIYDPAQVSYRELLDVFWVNVDPLDGGGQFCDRGDQYRSEIFALDEEQQRLAEASKRELVESGRFQQPIVTPVSPAAEFYPAEEYHQDYYEKNPLRYKFYRTGCGRDRRLGQLWGDAAGH